MLSINWRFGRDDGGQDAGFHDPGVETFRGDFNRYLARELIQNSLDAVADPHKPVCVRFSLERIPRGSIPDIESLCAAFERCGEYWDRQQKAEAFFRKAVQVANEPEISCLRISDFNTKGVRGGDNDRDKSWYNLVRSSGSTDKAAGEGGSFGIGKNAPFAASVLRTVIYSTRFDGGEYAFQGVAKLVTHLAGSGEKRLPVGYLGENGSSVRNSALVPQVFGRELQGADILILGFEAPDLAWQDDLFHSVLSNFWPAIHFGRLEVEIGSHHVRKENLEEMLALFSDQEGFTAHLYHRAFAHPTLHKSETLRHLKECSIYLLAAEDENMPKRVVMVRKTGMTIYSKRFNSLVPFCGVFLCTNDTGNELLRSMEPPKHNEWDPDLPERGASKKYEREYVKFIRDAIASLAPVDDSDHIEIEGLNRFLPDDGAEPEKPFESTEEEEASKEPAVQPPDFTIHPQEPSVFQPATNPSSSEFIDTPMAPAGDFDPNDEPAPPQPGKPPIRPTDSPTPPQQKGVSVPIGFRAFCVDPAAGRYRVSVISSDRAADLIFSLIAVGDDQRAVIVARSARLADGANPVTVNTHGQIGPISCGRGQKILLDVVMKTPGRYSLEVSAHEAIQ